MRKIAIVILLVSSSLGLWADAKPSCNPPEDTSLEIAVGVGELNGVPAEQRDRILPAVVGQLRSRLPFLKIVEKPEDSQLRITLSVGPFLRVKRIDAWPKEDWYKLEHSEPSAVVEGSEINCAGEAPVGEACEKLFILEFSPVDPAKTGEVIEYFVETAVDGLCEYLQRAPN